MLSTLSFWGSTSFSFFDFWVWALSKTLKGLLHGRARFCILGEKGLFLSASKFPIVEHVSCHKQPSVHPEIVAKEVTTHTPAYVANSIQLSSKKKINIKGTISFPIIFSCRTSILPRIWRLKRPQTPNTENIISLLLIHISSKNTRWCLFTVSGRFGSFICFPHLNVC